ncbi:DUF1569 domain-containing protein [Pseudoduganella namucuonensis]|uniref:DUF1569 domain-containing protein n=1 Tax=Pseudoduganella namucuonensis TaxID=1035707 RepID=A0A1I7F2L3_9BURK|nr:DUF1569 domain-containing protein [Pseudoduganella namucuonensis]SFU30370.1 Protein of unknown function [Pseudoduganella namucuonensis]
MQKKIDPTRRSFVIAAAGVTTALTVAGATSGCQADSGADRQLRFATLAAAEDELARLAQAGELASSAVWTWARTLAHCAQSIEFSMSGYPQSKSELFQRSVGAAALGVFAWRGRMTHDLAEPIPGAPSLEAVADPAPALERLRAAILAFRAWSGPLRPHFAYGPLDKKEYELAHAMHLANHLSAFRAKS